MTCRLLRVAAIAVVFLAFPDVQATELNRFERLSDGFVLSQNSVQAFAQDRSGYLWFGTQAGVEKFDGYRFESYGSDPDDPQTLSGRVARQLLVSRSGQIWVGTNRGLNRIDPDTGRVTRIGLRLSNGEIAWPPVHYGGLVEGVDGDIFAASSAGVMRWSNGGDVARPIHVSGPTRPLGRRALRFDRAGRLWLAARNGLWQYAPEANAFRRVLDSRRTGTNSRLAEDMLAVGPGDSISYVNANGVFVVDPGASQPIRHFRPSEFGFPSDRTDAVAVDSGNNFWLRLQDEIVRIPATRPQEWQRFSQPAFFGPSSSTDHARLQLVETPDGSMWLAGRFGLARYDSNSDRLINFRHDPGDPRSLPQTLGEIGYRIFLDDFGVLWVGANLGGLARLTPQSDRFTHLQDSKPSLISRNIVRAVAEHQIDSREVVWVANQNAGVSVWRRNAPGDYEIIHHYPGSDEDKASLGVVRAIKIQPASPYVWLAGRHALARVDKPGAPVDLVALEPDSPAMSPGLRALHFLDPETLLAGGGRRVWLLDVPDAGDPKILKRFNMPAGINVFDLLPLDDGAVLAAGMNGMAEFDPESGEIRVHYPAGKSEPAPGNDVFHLARDHSGRIWGGTRGAGLLRIDFDVTGGPEFKFYTRADGLPDDTIYAVLPDSTGSLWLSSNRGVIRFDPDGDRIRRYTPDDGLQAWEFNHTVAHIGAEGRYYFGGINGWNVFRPDAVRDLRRPPRVHLEAFSVNDTPLKVSDSHTPLTLEHDQNRTVIDFVGLQFTDPDRIRYAYRMAGLDDTWTEAGSSRQARYASLAPGHYQFAVKAANLDGVWSSPKQLLEFEVSQPPWLRPWAWLLYFACAGLFVIGLLRFQARKRLQLQRLVNQRTAQLREQKELVGQQAHELEQALEARTQLFANVSHEFRTPLTLIQASIDTLERTPDPEAAAMGRKYLDRLLRMVEQLLDLSRLRLAKSTESSSIWRLDPVVKQIAAAFRSAAERQGIHFHDQVNGVWHTRCSQNLVEKILLNLISNAVKFTPPGGDIKLSLQPAGENVIICVEDSGPGISESDQAMIFERFYRVRTADTHHVAGAGIGLALVAEAVRACNGNVQVTSRLGHGTSFRVTLPAQRPASEDVVRRPQFNQDGKWLDLIAPQADRNELDEPEPDPATAPAHNARRGVVLVVEDNADLRKYLARSLTPQWHVVQAVDGNRGYQRARESSPDVIVTDLMMPNADGFEMLARLRQDVETSHVPVMFLTARQDHETRLKAFTLSADAFLSKPFDPAELKARLEQIMIQRERIQAHLRAQFNRPTGFGASRNFSETDVEKRIAADLAPRDRQVMEKLGEWLASNSANPNASVNAMADAANLTPRTLQRKLKSLTDRTPTTYLREYRLARACSLLASTDDSVTDIGLACGFASPQQFSRAFRDNLGTPPEKWRRERRLDSS